MGRTYNRRGRLTSDTLQRSRLFSARKFLKGGRFNRLFLSDPIDVEYLSGFHSSNVFCLLSPRSNVLFTDFRYKEACLAFCRKNKEWAFVQIQENDFSFLASHVRPGNVVGYQSDVLTVDQFRLIRSRHKKVRFVRLPSSFRNIFVPKLPYEIRFCKEAARIGDKAFGFMLGRVKPGMTERQLAALLETYCRNFGSQKPSFDTITLFGSRSALPHASPSGRRLRRGDFVLCDFGCTVAGFASDMTRTFVMGRASVRQKKIYAVVRQAQEAARKAVSEGVRACEVDNSARSIISKAGYGPFFGHATGHGVGRRIHEKPRISGTDKSILHRATVITVEPGIYIPGFGGVRIEDMVAVTENGCEVLTSAPRNLIEAGSK